MLSTMFTSLCRKIEIKDSAYAAKSIAIGISIPIPEPMSKNVHLLALVKDLWYIGSVVGITYRWLSIAKVL